MQYQELGFLSPEENHPENVLSVFSFHVPQLFLYAN
jgi:hypothetical protein